MATNARSPHANRESQDMSEARPLLTVRQSSHDAPVEPSFDLLEITCICMSKFLDCSINVAIFPYINQMIHHVGNIPDQDLGFYSGLCDSLFYVVETMLSYFWAKLADRLGRKPVMVMCMSGMGLTTIAFGFSSSLWQIILFRCLGGLFGGASVSAATMLTEKTTFKTRGTAFSMLGSANNIALAIAPLIGGVLANPSKQWPRIFSHPFFAAYPYASPGIVIGGICLASALLFSYKVKETRRPSDHSGSVSQTSWSTRQLLAYPPLAITLGLLTMVSLLGAAIHVMVPLYLYTSPQLGGLGLSPVYISLRYVGVGLIQLIWSLVIFQFLESRLGVNWVMRLSTHIWPMYCVLFPIFAILLRHGYSQVAVYWSFAVTTCFLTSGWMMFVAIGMIVNNAAPDAQSLSTVNGIAGIAKGFMSATMPWLFTSIYAISVGRQILGGFLAFAILGCLAIPPILMTYALPSDGHAKRQVEDSCNDD